MLASRANGENSDVDSSPDREEGEGGGGTCIYTPGGESDAYAILTFTMAYLKVSGTKIVDQNGEEIILRGAGLGGWMKCVLTCLDLDDG